MIQAKEGTRGLLQKLLKQEEAVVEAGGMFLVRWWWFGRDTHLWQSGDGERCVVRRPQVALFHRECFAQLQGGDEPILYEAWLQETKKTRKNEPLTPECQTCQASERILQAARSRKDESTFGAWTMARCYSGSAAELVYHLSCVYTLRSALDKIEEKSQPQFQGDSADRGEIANHYVVSSSYSAAFECVAGYI